MSNIKEVVSIYDNLIEQIKSIDTKNIKDSESNEFEVISKIIEKQKVYFWIRLYLKEISTDITPGDDIVICYTNSGETLQTKFIAFGKKNLNRDLDNVIVNYEPENDEKILCLMVDEEDLLDENSKKIPFIRTLFKTSPHFQFQVYRREELTFTNKRTNISYEYVDCDF